ncbi:SLC18B1 [Bugula neritina]|uniref:SLC18B1 n=1 Tax=Bugula neritina TaxID=10212 RepID=A0A7J7KFW9_BUGNE|nr:SLC18B1 [Bugula neritina]
MEMTSQTEPLLSDGNKPSSESDISKETKKSKWTRTQILTAIILPLMNLVRASSFGVIVPFYPTEAAKKGVSTVVIGFIFGTYELVEFLASPIFGSIIVKVGARNMYLLGSFLLGGSSLAFGYVI